MITTRRPAVITNAWKQSVQITALMPPFGNQIIQGAFDWQFFYFINEPNFNFPYFTVHLWKGKNLVVNL